MLLMPICRRKFNIKKQYKNNNLNLFIMKNLFKNDLFIQIASFLIVVLSIIAVLSIVEPFQNFN